MNLYELLGIDEYATKDDIKSAFRKKAKILHPDINKSKDADIIFRQLVDAYEKLLTMPTKKRRAPHIGGETYYRFVKRNSSDEYVLHVPNSLLTNGGTIYCAIDDHGWEIRFNVQPNSSNGTISTVSVPNRKFKGKFFLYGEG